MYAYSLKEWNNIENGSFAKNVAKDVAIVAGITFAVEFTLVCMGLGIWNAPNPEVGSSIDIGGNWLSDRMTDHVMGGLI